MVMGIGMDIVSIQRVKEAIETSGDVFLHKVFTAAEIKRAAEHPLPLSYYAKTFAAKEAVFKLFGMGWDSGVQLSEIEIREGQCGEPLVQLTGTFLQVFESRGAAKILLSLTYENDIAAAVAILE